MPLYEYHCEKCDKVFEALRPLRDSDAPAPCPTCGRAADRIMPTTFASMSFNQGYAQRVPFYHRPIRSEADKPKTIAPVKSRARKSSRKKSGSGKGVG